MTRYFISEEEPTIYHRLLRGGAFVPIFCTSSPLSILAIMIIRGGFRGFVSGWAGVVMLCFIVGIAGVRVWIKILSLDCSRILFH